PKPRLPMPAAAITSRPMKLTVEILPYVCMLSMSDQVAGGHLPTVHPLSTALLLETARSPATLPTPIPIAPTPSPKYPIVRHPDPAEPPEGGSAPVRAPFAAAGAASNWTTTVADP